MRVNEKTKRWKAVLKKYANQKIPDQLVKQFLIEGNYESVRNHTRKVA